MIDVISNYLDIEDSMDWGFCIDENKEVLYREWDIVLFLYDWCNFKLFGYWGFYGLRLLYWWK